MQTLSDLAALVWISSVVVVEILEEADADRVSLLRSLDRCNYVRLLVQFDGRLAFSPLLEDLALRVFGSGNLFAQIDDPLDGIDVEHAAFHLLPNLVVLLVGVLALLVDYEASQSLALSFLVLGVDLPNDAIVLDKLDGRFDHVADL